MELSMWIIADKLGSFSPKLSISSGEMDIRGVRPLLAEKKLRKDILYVSLTEADGFFGTEDYVVCTHGADWIRLRTSDVDEVLNAILDIFESFQQWMSALNTAVGLGKNIQHLLDISSYALPFPIVISDSFGNIVGYSRDYDDYAELDSYWSSVVRKQQMNNLVFSETVYTEQRSPVRDWNTEAKIYQTMQSRIIGMHLTVNDEIVGTMVIIELGGRLTTGVCQLADVFHEALSKALSVRGDDAELRTVMAMAEEYLDGKAVDTSRLWEMINELTGRTDEELELVLLKNFVRTDFTYKNNLAYRLTMPENACFSLVYHDYVAAVIRCDREKEFFISLWKMLQQEEYLTGISLPFANVAALQKAGNQAALALLSGSQEPGSISRCVDHAYTYFLNKLAGDKSFGTELLHPGLARLRKYDEKHGTNFYDSLYQYLILERNVVATAKSLFIHRNSMIYRLQRIQQLLDVNLDDPNMRLYLLLSYQIEMVTNNKTTSDLFSARNFPGSEQGRTLFWADVRERL